MLFGIRKIIIYLFKKNRIIEALVKHKNIKEKKLCLAKIILVAAMSPVIVPLATPKGASAGLAFLVASACLMARALPSV